MLYVGDADYDSNWIGGQEIARMASVKGFDTAGFTNITTSDGIVHGQVKQAGLFSFSPIYEAGHEGAFYQPLTTYTIFERALKGMDVATGSTVVADGFVSSEPQTSTLREGNSTILKTVTPPSATFNTTTGKPQLDAVLGAMKSRKRSGLTRRGLWRSSGGGDIKQAHFTFNFMTSTFTTARLRKGKTSWVTMFSHNQHSISVLFLAIS